MDVILVESKSLLVEGVTAGTQCAQEGCHDGVSCFIPRVDLPIHHILPDIRPPGPFPSSATMASTLASTMAGTLAGTSTQHPHTPMSGPGLGAV